MRVLSHVVVKSISAAGLAAESESAEQVGVAQDVLQFIQAVTVVAIVGADGVGQVTLAGCRVCAEPLPDHRQVAVDAGSSTCSGLAGGSMSTMASQGQFQHGSRRREPLRPRDRRLGRAELFYEGSTPGERDVRAVTIGTFTWLIDATHESTLSDPDNRLIGVYGTSTSQAGPRKKSRIAGFPLPESLSSRRVHRGHALPGTAWEGRTKATTCSFKPLQ